MAHQEAACWTDAIQRGYNVPEELVIVDNTRERAGLKQLLERTDYRQFNRDRIKGTGRKQGVVVVREVVSLLDPDTIELALMILLGSKEMPPGSAVFHQA